MPALPNPARLLSRWRCCPPPPAPTGVSAGAGGGSGEVMITWTPVPAAAQVTQYRVYQQKTPGTWWLLAIVTDEALDQLEPGRLGVVDAPDYFPWPTGGTADLRTYAVSAVSARGLEGPMSAPVTASPL